MHPLFQAPLPEAFYAREPETVARELLGKWLVRRDRTGLCAGVIVETEAYLAQGDSACHAFRGRSRKNATMFGPAGRLYVYAIHSRYCLNAVTERRGVPSAVLIRALEPTLGIGSMEQRRGTDQPRDLTRGPGRLCEALEVDRRLDGWNLTRGDRIWIATPIEPPSNLAVGRSTRIGVTSAGDLPLRFFLVGNRHVSGPASWIAPRANSPSQTDTSGVR